LFSKIAQSILFEMLAVRWLSCLLCLNKFNVPFDR
jgi:hypothetical protein